MATLDSSHEPPISLRTRLRNVDLSSRIAIAIVSLVVITVAAVSYLGYQKISSIAIERNLVTLDFAARGHAADLASLVDNARADIKGARYTIGLDELVALSRDPSLGTTGGQTLEQWKQRIGARFAAELRAKPDILKFRLIGLDNGGREIVRTERLESGMVRIVPEEELQTKGERGFFEQAIAAKDGEIVVSPVELNQDHGAISTPHVPVIRISTPIFAADGSPFGAVIVNLDLRPVFRSLIASARPDVAIYAINDRGDYLLSPDKNRDFGFEFGKPFRIQDDFPLLAAAVASGAMAPAIVEQRDGVRFGAGYGSVWLGNSRPIAIVEMLPERTILGAIRSAWGQSVALGGGLALIAAAVLAVLLARSMTKPLTKMTSAVQRFGAGGGIEFPQDAAGEIGVLARAFAAMASDTRHASDSLQREKELFETIMNAIAEAVVLFDADANIVYENAASIAMRTVEPGRAPLPFDDAFELLRGDGVKPIPLEDRPSRRALRGERLDLYEVVTRLKGTDRIIHMLSSALPIVGASGRIDGAVLVIKNVTALKEAERRLHQAQKLEAIGQLTGGVAHDFNNMLTVISGTAEILLEELADRPDLATIARMIDQAAERGADLTRQLLAFARKQPLQPRSVDVNSVVDNVRQLLRPTIGEHIEIDAQLAADAEAAMIDPSQLSSALLNLAVNARDAMPNGGKLLFETANGTLDGLYAQQHSEVRAGRYVMIAVSDTGTGMAPEVLEKAFEPFFTTKGLGKGTGLGLSMVYGFVKQSNGHVSIYSEPGQGTTIRLYLPLAESAAESPPVVAPVAGGSETILLVEDDQLVRTFAAAQLAGLGYRAIAVADGREALELAQRGTPFDLLFTDVIMPGGLNGPQLAAAIARIRPVRVLYTSGYTENAIVHHGRLDAGVLLLAKPYSRADLARLVRQALTSSPTSIALGNAAS